MESLATPVHPEPPAAWRTAAACAALVIVFGVLSIFATLSKSATVDEPLHAVGSFLHVFHGDGRIDPEDPPLWKYWAMLPHRESSLCIDPRLPDFQLALKDTTHETRFSILTLYFTPGYDGERFIRRSRWMMLPLGLVLAALLAAWTWRLGGPVAALTATTLFCLDPNFIAHAPLLKNDVAITMMFLATVTAAWSVGRRLTWLNLPLLALLCGAALTTKFSGLLVAPMLALMMLGRAILPVPWRIGRTRELRSVAGRLVLAVGVGAVCALVSVGFIWMTYGFRFDPTPEPGARLNLETQVEQARSNAFFLRHGRFGVAEELARAPVPSVVRAAQWAESKRLLPQAYLYGFAYTYHSSQLRGGYLLGQHRDSGWWYYFPLAMLFKTPLATLLALFGSLAAWSVSRLRQSRPRSADRLDGWSVVCLTVPVLVYGTSAMASNLNLGLRHIFPVYPFLYLAVGIAAARLWRRSGRAFAAIAGVLFAGLALETVASFPHYLSFFNVACKPHRLHLLGDSNLDWGQDLPLLAQWQQRNPLTRPLYLAYFGAAPPDLAYGIDYVKIPGGYFLCEAIEWPQRQGGVIAISATVLQGLHLPPSLRQYYQPLRHARPREVLGGSIYLFDVPATPLPRPSLEAVEREMQLQRRHHGR